MTMAAGCAFHDGVVLIADSRATWVSAGGEHHFDDRLQKILHLSPKLAVGYAGNVALAGTTVQALRKAIAKNPRLEIPRRMAQELPRVARYFHKREAGARVPQASSVAFVLAGGDRSGKISLWTFRSPEFRAKEIIDSFDVLGTGDVVKHYLGRTFASLRQLPELKARADRLIHELEAELGKLTQHTKDTVGGLFQVILIGADGIKPMRYGFLDINVEGPGYARSIHMERGRWIQTDLSAGSATVLRQPHELVGQFVGERRIHDIRAPEVNGKIRRWHLQYFMTCLAIKRDVGSTEFVGEMTTLTGFGFPKVIPIMVTASFWGPTGSHEVILRLDASGIVTTLHQETVRIRYQTEPLELDWRVEIPVATPGRAYLELVVDGELLGRRALHFCEAPGPAPASREETVAWLKRHTPEAAEQHVGCDDPVLRAEGGFLSYFVLCQELIDQPTQHKFLGEMRAVYWKNYPLAFKFFLATCFQLPRGQHRVRLDLVNVATRQATNVANATISATADCRQVPVQGELIARIPEPGLYFFSLYVNDRLLSCIPIPFETGRDPFSYTLTDDAAKEVAGGQLLILSKRSQQQTG